MTEVAKRLERHPQLTEDPTTALTEVFIAVNHALEEEASKGETFMEPMFSGCTAVVVYVLDDVMWVANTGDSRAVLCVKHGDSVSRVPIDAM
jgi:serine/threonine protein phosphatase PrpC